MRAKSVALAVVLAASLSSPVFAAGEETRQPPAAVTGEQTTQQPAVAGEQLSGPPAPVVGGQEAGPPAAAAEQYKFEPSEIEKKPYHIGGFLEARPVLNGLNKGSALYKTNFYNQHEPGSLGELNSRLQIDGSLEKGIARLFVRGNFSANDTDQGWSKIGTLL